jgi:hypothetical protein
MTTTGPPLHMQIQTGLLQTTGSMYGPTVLWPWCICDNMMCAHTKANLAGQAAAGSTLGSGMSIALGSKPAATSVPYCCSEKQSGSCVERQNTMDSQTPHRCGSQESPSNLQMSAHSSKTYTSIPEQQQQNYSTATDSQSASASDTPHPTMVQGPPTQGMSRSAAPQPSCGCGHTQQRLPSVGFNGLD